MAGPHEIPRIISASLEPIARFLNDRKGVVTEVSVNEEGAVWVERAGEGYIRVNEPSVTKQWAILLCQQLANLYNINFNKEVYPLLSAPLPTGERRRHRLQAVLGSNCLTGICLSIRVARPFKATLDDFGMVDGQISVDGKSVPIVPGTRDQETAGIVSAFSLIDTGHPVGSPEDLKEVCRRGGSVLVSGGTNSGKTTLLKTLATHIPAHKRVITVEDTPELDVPQENFVGLLADSSNTGTRATYKDLIKAVLRLNPSSIQLGELQPDNIETALRLFNSGHDDVHTTLHADSPMDALNAAATLFQIATGRNADTVIPFLVRKFTRIVQMNTNRQIETVVRPVDLPWKQLLGQQGRELVDPVVEQLQRISERLSRR